MSQSTRAVVGEVASERFCDLKLVTVLVAFLLTLSYLNILITHICPTKGNRSTYLQP